MIGFALGLCYREADNVSVFGGGPVVVVPKDLLVAVAAQNNQPVNVVTVCRAESSLAVCPLAGCNDVTDFDRSK
jgi:hypothetical protein